MIVDQGERGLHHTAFYLWSHGGQDSVNYANLRPNHGIQAGNGNVN